MICSTRLKRSQTIDFIVVIWSFLLEGRHWECIDHKNQIRLEKTNWTKDTQWTFWWRWGFSDTRWTLSCFTSTATRTNHWSLPLKWSFFWWWLNDTHCGWMQTVELMRKIICVWSNEFSLLISFALSNLNDLQMFSIIRFHPSKFDNHGLDFGISARPSGNASSRVRIMWRVTMWGDAAHHRPTMIVGSDRTVRKSLCEYQVIIQPPLSFIHVNEDISLEWRKINRSTLQQKSSHILPFSSSLVHFGMVEFSTVTIGVSVGDRSTTEINLLLTSNSTVVQVNVEHRQRFPAANFTDHSFDWFCVEEYLRERNKEKQFRTIEINLFFSFSGMIRNKKNGTKQT